MATGNDIFNYKRAPKASATFSNEDTFLTFGGEGSASIGAVGHMVQQWAVSYTQQVQEVFELGSNRLYWSKGRPVGQGSLGRLVGPKAATTGGQSSLFPAAALDACKGGARFKLSAKGGNCDEVDGQKTHGTDITMDGVLVVSLGWSTNVQDTRLQEAVAIRFGWMQVVDRVA